MKKALKTRISVIADKTAARGANPAHDKTFWQRSALAAGRHALVRLPADAQP